MLVREVSALVTFSRHHRPVLHRLQQPEQMRLLFSRKVGQEAQEVRVHGHIETLAPVALAFHILIASSLHQLAWVYVYNLGQPEDHRRTGVPHLVVL